MSEISKHYQPSNEITLFEGNCLDFLKELPDNSIQLIVTSPPYNIGKEYEKKLNLNDYIRSQEVVIKQCYRVLKTEGHICWQVGNYTNKGSIIPLDTILYPVFSDLNLKMRNRIIWHFEHGLHCKNRFSGRYETIMWFTKSDDYYFNLDPVRIPQKYPGKKYFKGPKAGQYSCNPLGKNPGDIWTIPNVKCNHVEKTEHPCQFPIELVERLVLSMTKEQDAVFDPFCGVSSAILAAILNNRKGHGAEINDKYLKISKERIKKALNGNLKVRPMLKPVYDPREAGKKLTTAPWLKEESNENCKYLFTP